MGRIEEALRRAGETDVGVATSRHQNQFVSAWGVERSDTLSATHVARASGNVSNTEPGESLFITPAGVSLPASSALWGERLASDPSCSADLVEQFRRLAAVLHKSQATDGTKIVMVTSAAPSDGKTMTAINLALALSESYKRRVLLIDADLRRPSIGDSLGIRRSAGLSEALKARLDQKLSLVPVTPMLSLLPAGRPDPDPMGALTSDRLRRILEEAASRFDWIVLDAPPVGLLPDANLLAEEVDRALLVVRAGRTQFPMIQKAIELIGRQRLLGVVLNAVDASTAKPYHSYRYTEQQ
jgi:capsular exopolysaccharide synthesis family protein